METIYYQSPIGALKLSGTEAFLQELSFLNTAKTGVEKECPTCVETPESVGLRETLRQLDDYFSGRNLKFDLQLEQQGTPFQQQVWKALLNIQPGKTLSYMQLSKNLGDPKAIRAVGTANGRNQIAIIVPCHRVIGANGDLVGYAGDLWRKQWLLEHEAKYSNGVQMLF